MAINTKTDIKPYSLEHIANQSFDSTYQFSVVELGLENSGQILRAQADADGFLKVNVAAGSTSGTQYTEGDTDASITGTAAMMEGGANTLLPIQGTVADGLLVNLGSNNDVSLNAGTNNIGDVDVLSIAAGSNNIGDVDIASIAAGDNNIGNVDIVTLPALAAGTNAVGKLLPPDIDITTHTNYAKKYYTNAGAVTDGIIWSPAAGKRWHVHSLFIQVSAAATVTLEDDKAGGDEAILKMELAANSGLTIPFPEKYPLASGEDAADLIITTSAGNVYVTCVGYEI